MILQVENVRKEYPLRKFWRRQQVVKALDGVSFSLGTNKTLAIVGESGCGKSTLAKVLLQLEEKTAGQIWFENEQIELVPQNELRRKIQMVFQDPYNSLNPRKNIFTIVSEPLRINGWYSAKELKRRVAEKLELVGMRSEVMYRYPHMFSGGQRQRIGIARALMLNPKLLICDEPVSALDISIQAQVLNLLIQLQNELKLSYIFISHDLSVVEHIANDVLVMYLGKVVESGSCRQIFESPQHPYTVALLNSTLRVAESKRLNLIQGELPSPLAPPSGCSFHTRCPIATAECQIQEPKLRTVKNRLVACDVISSEDN